MCSRPFTLGQLRTVCPLRKNVDSFRGAVDTLGVAVSAPGVTVCSPKRTVCPEGKGVDSFKGAEASLGMTVCVLGETVCPPMGTMGTLVRAGSSFGTGSTKRKGRSPKETVCPLFAVSSLLRP